MAQQSQVVALRKASDLAAIRYQGGVASYLEVLDATFSFDGVIGAFYLTEKESGGSFDAADQAVIELLAAHAAIAITYARLYEQSRELSTLAERNRLDGPDALRVEESDLDDFYARFAEPTDEGGSFIGPEGIAKTRQENLAVAQLITVSA